MGQSINLLFDKSITKLSGNKLGRKIYDEQIKGKIDLNSHTELVFPDYIDFLASSFIQGLFYEIVKEFGIKYVQDHISVAADLIPNINDFVIASLLSGRGDK